MLRNKFAIIIAAGLVLAPAQLLAQSTGGGSALPPRPGDRATSSNGVGGSALPTQTGQRVAPSSGSSAGSAAPAVPGSSMGTTGNASPGR
jgi:hypothetical protein